MIYDFVIKSKQIWVPSSKGRKGYYREDPREKHFLEDLKNLLREIIGMKKKGILTNKQRTYIHNKLKDLEPRAKYFKNQKQRMEVFKVLKQIRLELSKKESAMRIEKLWDKKYKRVAKKYEKEDKPKKEISLLSKDGKVVNDEFRDGLKRLGYTSGDIKKYSLHEIKAIHYNDIKKHVILEKAQVSVKPYQRKGKYVVGYHREGKEGSWQSEKNEEKRQYQEKYDKFYPFVDEDAKPIIPEFTVDELVGEYVYGGGFSPDEDTIEDLAAGLHDHYFSASLESKGSREKHYKQIQTWMGEWWEKKIRKDPEDTQSKSTLDDFKSDLKSKVSQIVGMDYKKIEDLIVKDKKKEK